MCVSVDSHELTPVEVRVEVVSQLALRSNSHFSPLRTHREMDTGLSGFKGFRLSRIKHQASEIGQVTSVCRTDVHMGASEISSPGPHDGIDDVRLAHCDYVRVARNIRINQEKVPEHDKLLRKLRGEADRAGFVRNTSDGTDGKCVVLADAVQPSPNAEIP